MDIKPYSKNAKKHPKKQIEQIAESIKEFGMNQPIVVDKKGIIIVGHGRYEALNELGWEIKPEWIKVVDLTEEQAKAYRLADNKLNESEWDMGLAIEELRELSDKMFDLTGFDRKVLNDDNPYTTKIASLIYEPKGEMPEVNELCNLTKVEELQKEIEGVKMPEDVKEFLKNAARRHAVFNYEKIAEYYANASKEIQELMEKSALVLIDFDKAIVNGFIEMTKNINELQKEEYGE